MKTLLPKVTSYIENIKNSEIPHERIQALQKPISFLQEKLNKDEPIYLNFICTHNSRRSQLCQVWAQTFGYHLGIKNLQAFSGGTEATAFHPNAVRALNDSGFRIIKESGGENPVYLIFFSEESEPLKCYSKIYSEALPHGKIFAAILTCSDAEANCPFIPEAEARFSVKYEDPKKADGTELERQTYSERNGQIASEMLYIFSQLKTC
ncbi:arsenate reductase [Salinimicrobium marinum]|uniref:Arsenate reductase n=1 Tax=Salinimicrobium marinum TaxID=680283 RepID=A0A918SEL2_9FLAO|nr:protein-tyrosine-phosphatase [Salinimicrobium marinum]GHA37677.1 arsenate reductase [Salinimicrobium marinum]